MASRLEVFLILSIGVLLRKVLSQGSGTNYTYLGCVYDDHRREILPDLIFCDRDRHPYDTCRNICGRQENAYCQSDVMTIELCRDICLDQNMKYFGLEAGTQCLCGGYFAPWNRLGSPPGSNDTCVYQCTGNSSQICGGEFLISMYEIDDPRSDCFHPGYVVNGEQDNITGLYNVGDAIAFDSICQAPNVRNGSSSINCVTPGAWDSSPPYCIVMCPTPAIPDNARVTSGQTLKSDYAVGDIVSFECLYQSMPQISIELTCGSDGSWTTGSGICPEASTVTSQPTDMSQSTEASNTPTGALDERSSTDSSIVVQTTNDVQDTTRAPDGSHTNGSSATQPATVTQPQPTRDGQGGGNIELFPIFIGASAGLLVVLVLFITICVCCKRSRTHKSKNIPFDPDSNRHLQPLEFANVNPAFEPTTPTGPENHYCVQAAQRPSIDEPDYDLDYEPTTIDYQTFIPPERTNSSTVAYQSEDNGRIHNGSINRLSSGETSEQALIPDDMESGGVLYPKLSTDYNVDHHNTRQDSQVSNQILNGSPTGTSTFASSANTDSQRNIPDHIVTDDGLYALPFPKRNGASSASPEQFFQNPDLQSSTPL